MCSIYGAYISGVDGADKDKISLINYHMLYVWRHAHMRGRDGRGFSLVLHNGTAPRHEERHVTPSHDGLKESPKIWPSATDPDLIAFSLIGNTRAEPTTEYVANKREADQQPYSMNKWSIVHNGQLANDKALRAQAAKFNTEGIDTVIDSAAIAEFLAAKDLMLATRADDSQNKPIQSFLGTISQLKGSYAILATHADTPKVIYYACNYKPIWYAEVSKGCYVFASSRHAFRNNVHARMIEPYTAGFFDETGAHTLTYRNNEATAPERVLVVCSGGLDSVVAATDCVTKWGADNVELIHFQYGCRAQTPEETSVRNVAQALGVKLKVFPLPVYSPKDSNLFDPNAKVAGGEEGAEFAHEWVPARNTVLMAVTIAYAEANHFSHIALGNNLEEAGAYPDNEPEFIDRFNDLLPFAVGDGVRLEIIQPVGNLTKREIVELGVELKAPLHLTWSCYRARALHCGKCGPCYMRKKAFAISGQVDPIQYEDDDD